MSTRPLMFRASLYPDDIVFNHEIVVDLFWLEGRPVLHVVDTNTCFQGADVLRSKSAEEVWSALMECLVTLYLG